MLFDPFSIEPGGATFFTRVQIRRSNLVFYIAAIRRKAASSRALYVSSKLL